MSVLICFIFPSFISICIEKNLLKQKNYEIKNIINFGIYCLINNMISLCLMIKVIGIQDNVEKCIYAYPGVAVKYALISIVVAIILSLAKIIIIKNIGVEIETNRKKNN